jgi:hypothetical protein
MKHTVATCDHKLATTQWRPVEAELEVAHGRQPDGSQHGGKRGGVQHEA